MLVVMRQGATSQEIDGVARAIEARGYKAHPIPGAQRTAIGITGNRGTEDRPVFESMPGVLEVIADGLKYVWQNKLVLGAITLSMTRRRPVATQHSLATA